MTPLFLSNGVVSQVDEVDLDYLLSFKWHECPGTTSRTSYATTSVNGATVYMHRLIAARMGLKLQGKVVDHKDTNGLNNLRSNLRLLSHSQNSLGRLDAPLRKNNFSGATGIIQRPETGKWRARIQVQGRTINLGEYPSFDLAFAARQEAVRKQLE